MKKRIISLLLTLCMVVTMCVCLGTTAAADDTFSYTMTKGDTIWGLCQAKGLNYYSCKNAIMKLNSFTSETQLSSVAVGKVIIMPISDAAAQTIASSAGGTTTTTSSTTGSTTTTTTTGALSNGDTIAYYLVAHKMTAGETVLYIYNSWGMNYHTYSDLILSINNLDSYKKMYAGRTYLFPVPTVPAGQTAAYSIINHKVAAGETAYNICSAYNTNYNGALTIVKAVNSGNNLTTIRTNQVVKIPASGYVSVSGTGTGSGTGSGTGTGTPATGTSYAINKSATKNGSFVARVGTSDVTTAASGSSVAIVTTPTYGYVVDSITVSKAGDASTTVATNSSVFTMPAYAVNISVTFKQASSVSSGTAHKITFSSISNGSATAVESGNTVLTAKAGTFITVVPTAKTGYKLESVKVSYNKGASTVPLSGNAFNMPDYDVTIDVKFAAVSTNTITALATTNGSFSFKADGVAAKKAWEGQTVTIVPAPKANYAVESVKVTYASGAAVSMIDAYSFKMPAEPVRVAVTFSGSFGVYANKLSHGSVSFQVDGVAATKAVTGKDVVILPLPSSGYTVDEVNVYFGSKAADVVPANLDTTVVKNSNDLYVYSMGDKAVIVDVTFKAVDTYPLPDCKDIEGNYLRYKVNGGVVTEAAENAVVTVEPVCVDGFMLTALSSADLGATPTVTDGKVNGTFEMPIPADPSTGLDLSATFTEISKQDVVVTYNPNRCTPTLSVDNKAIMGVSAAATAPLYTMTFSGIYEGKTAVLGFEFKTGFELGTVTANCNGKKVSVSDTNTFTVGVGADTNVKVTCDGKHYSIICDSTTLEHCSYTMVDANGQTVNNSAATGTTIYVRPEPDDGYTVKSISATYLENGVEKTRGSMEGNAYKFVMPGGDVTLKLNVVSVKNKISKLKLDIDPSYAGSDFVLKMKAGGKQYLADDIDPDDSSTFVSVAANSTVTIEPVLKLAGFKVTNVSIVNGKGESIIDKIDYDEAAMTFKMPADYSFVKITVRVEKTA